MSWWGYAKRQEFIQRVGHGSTDQANPRHVKQSPTHGHSYNPSEATSPRSVGNASHEGVASDRNGHSHIDSAAWEKGSTEQANPRRVKHSPAPRPPWRNAGTTSPRSDELASREGVDPARPSRVRTWERREEPLGAKMNTSSILLLPSSSILHPPSWFPWTRACAPERAS